MQLCDTIGPVYYYKPEFILFNNRIKLNMYIKFGYKEFNNSDFNLTVVFCDILSCIPIFIIFFYILESRVICWILLHKYCPILHYQPTMNTLMKPGCYPLSKNLNQSNHIGTFSHLYKNDYPHHNKNNDLELILSDLDANF